MYSKCCLQAVCCFEYRKWFIIWSVRTYIKDELNDDDSYVDLDDIIGKFNNIVNDLLQKLSSGVDAATAPLIFTILYDILRMFHDDIRPNVALDARLELFLYVVKSLSNEEGILIKFIDSYVISNAYKATLRDRSSVLLKTAALFATRSIQFTVLSHIFQYYNTVLYNGNIYNEHNRLYL